MTSARRGREVAGPFQRRWLPMDWNSALVGLISIAALVIVSFAWLRAQAGDSDFLSFYAGAKLAGSPHLYSVQRVNAIQANYARKPEEVRAYIRLPYYAALLWPLGRLPYRKALVIWELINIAALAGFILFWSPRAINFPLACFYFPTWQGLMGGQDVPLVLLCFSASAFLLLRKRDVAAGLVMALCAAKFHIFLLLPLVIVARRLWRFGFGFATGSAVLLAACFAVGGRDWPARYYELIQINERAQASQRHMPNLNGLFHAWPYATLWVALFSVAVLVGTWYVARRVSLRDAMAFMLCGGLLVSLHAFIYDFCFLLPFFLLLAARRSFGQVLFLSSAVGAASLTLLAPSISFLAPLATLSLFGAAVYEAYRETRRGMQPAGV